MFNEIVWSKNHRIDCQVPELWHRGDHLHAVERQVIDVQVFESGATREVLQAVVIDLAGAGDESKQTVAPNKKWFVITNNNAQGIKKKLKN